MATAITRSFALSLALACVACGGRAAETGHASHPGDAAGATFGGSAAMSGGGTASGGANFGSAGMLVQGGNGSTSNGGEAGVAGLSSASGAGGATSAAEQAVCKAFLPLWEVRQDDREPGSPAPPNGSDPACYRCFNASQAECKYPLANGCEPSTACVERHCLCESSTDASCAPSDYPADLCACIQSCLPEGSGCYGDWLAYMACANSRCMVDCQP